MKYDNNKYIDIITGQTAKDTIDAANQQKYCKTQHSEKVLFVANTLFHPLSKILESIEIINLIPIFIRTFPYNCKGVSKVRYLQYHIGNYYVEMGILCYRLIAYLGKVKNGYRKTTGMKKKVELLYKVLKEYIETVFKEPQDIRDTHIHEFRYTDKELDNLQILELITQHADKSEEYNPFKAQYEGDFRKLRKKWCKIIKVYDEHIKQTLEFYFDAFYKIITPDGKIIYPCLKQKLLTSVSSVAKKGKSK